MVLVKPARQIYLFLAVFFFFSCGNVKVTVKESHESYANGKLKWVKRVTTRQNKHVQRDANFIRTVTEYHSYYNDGKLHIYWKLVEDTGPEITCNETLYELRQYYANGKKQRTYKMQCDCHKEKEKTYNENGKLLSRKKAVIKRLY